MEELQSVKCPNCGGQMERIGEKTFKCAFCLDVFELQEELTNNDIIELNRGEHYRKHNRYDEAIECYDEILKSNPDNVIALWGAFLSEYGIEYVDDYDGRKIPTCHRANMRSVANSRYYKKLPQEYQNRAEVIEKTRQEVVEKMKGLEKYDVFICYKNQTQDGKPTKESRWGRKIYEELTYKKGLKVFFAGETLANSNAEYEPQIFNALRTSKIMFVLASSLEYVNAAWVKNEWKRFYEMSKTDTKVIRVVYEELEPYDFPKELQKSQMINQDDGDWLSSIFRAVDDIFVNEEDEKSKKQEEEARRAEEQRRHDEELESRLMKKLGSKGGKNSNIYINTTVSQTPKISEAEIKNALNMAKFALEDSNYNEAISIYNSLLEKDDNCSQAWKGLYNVAELLVKIGKFADAEKIYKKILSKNSEDSDAWYGLYLCETKGYGVEVVYHNASFEQMKSISTKNLERAITFCKDDKKKQRYSAYKVLTCKLVEELNNDWGNITNTAHTFEFLPGFKNFCATHEAKFKGGESYNRMFDDDGIAMVNRQIDMLNKYYSKTVWLWTKDFKQTISDCYAQILLIIKLLDILPYDEAVEKIRKITSIRQFAGFASSKSLERLVNVSKYLYGVDYYKNKIERRVYEIINKQNNSNTSTSVVKSNVAVETGADKRGADIPSKQHNVIKEPSDKETLIKNISNVNAHTRDRRANITRKGEKACVVLSNVAFWLIAIFGAGLLFFNNFGDFWDIMMTGEKSIWSYNYFELVLSVSVYFVILGILTGLIGGYKDGALQRALSVYIIVLIIWLLFFIVGAVISAFASPDFFGKIIGAVLGVFVGTAVFVERLVISIVAGFIGLCFSAIGQDKYIEISVARKIFFAIFVIISIVLILWQYGLL